MHEQDRTNTDMALIVEQGLSQDREHGSVVAWKFLAAHHVPDEVILRVLADPAMRRGSDAPGQISPLHHPPAADPPPS
ncbi:hypothetical protein [Massilia sp. CF038]|uniref:hypothetical protein n=1 Tax=Massilia sp. CF038 TaxID=1881045 RepID=UPI0009161B55|nr:hypothetical protein [Massilia sp. CF038]SHH19063.1 hypothetical protein SAMN05428948_3233 [Massilia sp. CF038]